MEKQISSVEKLINNFGDACLKAGKTNSGFCVFVTGAHDIKSMQEAKKALLIKLGLIIELLEDLQDPYPCELDHHGNCLAHGWADMKGFPPWRECPQKRLREILSDKSITTNIR